MPPGLPRDRPPPTLHACCAALCWHQGVVDVHIFESSRRVVERLRQHDCGAALAWCEENRAKLRKSKSKLEFRLRVQVGRGGVWAAWRQPGLAGHGAAGCWGHGGKMLFSSACFRGAVPRVGIVKEASLARTAVGARELASSPNTSPPSAPHLLRPALPPPPPQEFIELVRAGRRSQAIAYARGHLAPFAPAHMPELQRAAAALAFGPGTTCGPYQRLFDESQVGRPAGRVEGYRLRSRKGCGSACVHVAIAILQRCSVQTLSTLTTLLQGLPTGLLLRPACLPAVVVRAGGAVPQGAVQAALADAHLAAVRAPPGAAGRAGSLLSAPFRKILV